MCTAATYQTKDFYFGRTLDFEFNYECEVTVMPRNYPLVFRHLETQENHYAMIGMAYVLQDYPLFYDAVNEHGLGMAGLNFVRNAQYSTAEAKRNNVATFELIPWILGQCANVQEARQQIAGMNLTQDAFCKELPPAQLHWLISDSKESITLEVVAEGIQVYDNPVGVLTNNPPFPQQLFQLNNYRKLSPKNSENNFSERLSLDQYSRGMGALGLPG
ncbi:MAG: linear amide C-N hydrolase, partial [Lachnospiraceae bacterium]|nr:linear amide C-N hydrolase [Lachnospiraceae bacterium]